MKEQPVQREGTDGRARVLIWLPTLLAAVVAVWVIPDLVRSIYPKSESWSDFYQDWKSARFFLQGEPVYQPHLVCGDPDKVVHAETGQVEYVVAWIPARNAHPPPSILLALPFAFLEYPEATLVWNLLSLAALALGVWIVRQQLQLRLSGWLLGPALALLLLCNPFRQQVQQAQFNLLLLLLILLAWAASRSGRTGWAGVLLGAATAIKLFPGFLFLLFLVRRQYRALAAGLAAFGLITAAGVAILGGETYRAYRDEALPYTAGFRSSWLNASLTGFFCRLFAPVPEPSGADRIVPLCFSPALAQLATALAVLFVTAVCAWVIWRAQAPQELDHAWGVTLIGMLLVSPVTWDHYLLLLFLPLTLLGRQILAARGGRPRWFYLAILACFWVNPMNIWALFIPDTGFLPDGMLYRGVANPLHALTVLSFQFHALLTLFVLAVIESPGTISTRGFRIAAVPDPKSAI